MNSCFTFSPGLLTFSALLTFNANLRQLEPARTELEPWGLLFSPDLSKVEGAKQIPPETIFVGEDATIEPNPQGNPMEWVDWSRQMRNNVTLINPQHLQKWYVCSNRIRNGAIVCGYPLTFKTSKAATGSILTRPHRIPEEKNDC